MRAYLLTFALCLATVAPGREAAAQTTPALPADRAKALVDSVQAFYDQTRSFQSDFSQEFFIKSHDTKKQSKGRVIFSKPGKMRWEYSDPKDNRVVSDGSLLRVYDAANQQMFEQSVDKSQYPAALSFLVGGGRLDATFTFELFDGAAMSFPGGKVLVGTPKEPTPAYTKVLFYVDAATSQVRRVLIVDGQGNRNRFDFASPRVNEPIKDEIFRFEPPPGTHVIKP